MVRFRFGIILLCVLLPPLFYAFSVQLLERHGGRSLQAGLERVFLGDVEPLLQGARPIRAAITRNVDAYLKQSRWLAWGGKATIIVRAADNTLLYPLSERTEIGANVVDLQPVAVALENYRLLNQAPTVSLDFRLPHGSAMANAVLAFYTLTAFGALFAYYRGWKVLVRREMERQALERQELAGRSRAYEQQLAVIEEERLRLDREVRAAQEKLDETVRRAESSEEEMVEEIVVLEKELSEKMELQKQQQADIDGLQSKIDQLESQLQREQGRKTRSGDMVLKRLAALYKNLEITQRAVQGYLDLTEEMKIKCEEVIHQLDADPSKVIVKRKVFGKKNRETVFEVVFGYKGRLYFLPKETRKNAVLAIGTKNSQQQDLEYLDRL